MYLELGTIFTFIIVIVIIFTNKAVQRGASAQCEQLVVLGERQDAYRERVVQQFDGDGEMGAKRKPCTNGGMSSLNFNGPRKDRFDGENTTGDGDRHTDYANTGDTDDVDNDDANKNDMNTGGTGNSNIQEYDTDNGTYIRDGGAIDVSGGPGDTGSDTDYTDFDSLIQYDTNWQRFRCSIYFVSHPEE